MPIIPYIEKNFRADSLDIIETADAICREYAAAGFDLTLRQLYYQFVARDLLPNTQQSYNRLGAIISDARNLLDIAKGREAEQRDRIEQMLERHGHMLDVSDDDGSDG